MIHRVEYLGIGHSNADDCVWLLQGDRLYVVRVGDGVAATGYAWSHWAIWGAETDDSWHGRFEKLTGRCSVVPPQSHTGVRRPPQALTDTLKARLPVRRFYFFGNGKGEIATASGGAA